MMTYRYFLIVNKTFIHIIILSDATNLMSSPYQMRHEPLSQDGVAGTGQREHQQHAQGCARAHRTAQDQRPSEHRADYPRRAFVLFTICAY